MRSSFADIAHPFKGIVTCQNPKKIQSGLIPNIASKRLSSDDSSKQDSGEKKYQREVTIDTVECHIMLRSAQMCQILLEKDRLRRPYSSDGWNELPNDQNASN